jgi:MFS family permease
VFYGWLIVLVIAFTQAIAVGILNYSYGTMVVPLAAEFDASRSSMMLGMSAAALVSGCLSPILGAQLDKRSLRNMMLGGVLLLSAGLIGMSFIQAVWQFILIFALCFSFTIFLIGSITSATLITRWFDRYRGRALGMAAVGMSLGGFVMPVITQLLIEVFGWRSAAANTGTNTVAGGEVHYNSTQALLRQRSFWLMGVSFGLSFSIFTALVANLAPFAIGRGIEPLMAAQLVSLMAVFGMLGKILFGYVADKINLKSGLWAAQLLITICLILLASSPFPSYGRMVIAVVAAGLAAGGLAPVWTAMLANVFGTANYGRVAGAMNMLITGFILLGPISAGKIFDMTGSYIPAFQLYVGMLLLAALILVPVRLKSRN